MNKKAQKELIWLIHLILVGLIILALLASTKKISEGTYYQEKVFSKNIAFLYDAVMSSPYKTEAGYQINPDYGLSIELDENCIVKTKNQAGSFNSHSCALNTYTQVNCKTQTNCITKENNINFKNG